MPPSQQAGRVNLQELKAKLSKVLGPDKESQYFSIFSRFLSHRLTKSELDRQVVLTIGKENIALHNQIVKAILYNAACPEPPLPVPATNTSKPVKGVRRKPLTPSANNDDALLHLPASAARSNGDGILVSPRKNRSSGFRDRKAKERQSSQVKEEASTSLGDVEDGIGISRHGKPEVDLLRPLQKLQGVAEQPDADSLTSVAVSLKRPRLVLPADESRGPLRHSPLTDEAVEDQECTLWHGSPVRAPLGIPFCVGSVGAAQRAGPSSCSSNSSSSINSSGSRQVLPLTHSLLGDHIDEDCLETSDLPDGEGMLRRMQQIAVVEEGMQGVSSECANLLNQAVDIYLKRLISASLSLVHSRRAEQQLPVPGKQLSSNGLNGMWQQADNHHQHHHPKQQMIPQIPQMQQQQQQVTPVTALDLKVAMDANPQLLGENRPVHLERIMLRVFEQQGCQQVLL